MECGMLGPCESYGFAFNLEQERIDLELICTSEFLKEPKFGQVQFELFENLTSANK